MEDKFRFDSLNLFRLDHFKASEKFRLKGRGINPYFLMSFELLLRILGNIAGDMECGINTSSCKFTFLLM